MNLNLLLLASELCFVSHLRRSEGFTLWGLKCSDPWVYFSLQGSAMSTPRGKARAAHLDLRQEAAALPVQHCSLQQTGFSQESHLCQ